MRIVNGKASAIPHGPLCNGHLITYIPKGSAGQPVAAAAGAFLGQSIDWGYHPGDSLQRQS